MTCLLKIGVIGLNHKTAGLALREAMAKGAAALGGDKAIFFPHPIVLLSTCNRTEIYFGGDDLTAAHSDLLNTLRRQIPDAFEHCLYSYFGIDCFEHLGRVTAGLDSAIVAETEIQRQVKIAYAKATEFCSLPSCMHYVFQKSLKIGKFIRNRLEMDLEIPPLFQAIWALSEDLYTKRILLIGHSEINRKIARALFQKGLHNIALATQNPSAVSLPGVSPCSRDELERWHDYDVIICASFSDRYLLSGTASSNQIIFDLSVPRNVDPTMQGGKLYNIEEVNQWIEQRRALQIDKVTECLDLLRQETIRTAKAYRQKTLFATCLRT